MNSKYFKNKEKDIKKSKSEINFHLNFAKINAEKEKYNINIKKENSKNLSPSEKTQNININNNNSKTSEEITDYNLNENKNYTIKSLDSENSEENKENNSSSKKINIEQYNNSKNNKNSKKILLINSDYDKICRCCGKKYDDNLHRPIKLKCNHSFCKVCLGKYFTEENNIVCPIDGPVNRTFEGLNYVKKNNNRNKGNNKKRNSKNSIQSLIHKSNSHKE